MQLLLIEDEQEAALMIAKGLRQDSHSVDIATDGQSGLNRALCHPYDLIVLDVRLPLKDGWAVCRELRHLGLQTPILMLTASGSYQDRVKGLDLGADDYLVKPFDIDELLARVRALLRRRPLMQNPILRLDTLEINTGSKTVTRAGKFVRVTAKEYALLECLARDADTLLDRETISERVWNEPYDPFSNLIEEYIKRLRKKIDVEGQKPLIRGRRGEGYILTAKEFA
ncbi:MAG TPA: response regulator transcription factor [Bryobacteraceae bacterium]|jgi:two-component system copper resistance phosphate regulon response regulator CusR|nr:response regulator transcription factor [Bryobacteraceae bacterium]